MIARSPIWWAVVFWFCYSLVLWMLVELIVTGHAGGASW